MLSARLYVVSGEAAPELQAEILCRAIDGGAEVVQLRHKTAAKGGLLSAARRVREYAHSQGALFIVNDHLDLAMAAEADGVHLGQDDLPIDIARKLWPGAIVGCSTHSHEQALAAQASGADYLGVGPVYSTPTKPGRAAVGTMLLGAMSDVELPWFAIGGIDGGNLAEVLAAGASRVAVVRAVCDAPDPAGAARDLRRRISLHESAHSAMLTGGRAR